MDVSSLVSVGRAELLGVGADVGLVVALTIALICIWSSTVAAVLPILKEKKSGHIVTTASVAGHKVFPASATEFVGQPVVSPFVATLTAVRGSDSGLWETPNS